MPRLIDADALIAQIETNICKPCKERKDDYHGVRCRACQYGDEIDDIDDAPTIEERKTGKWIEFDCDEDKYDIIKCPCCKHTFTVDSYHWTDIGFVKDDFKFCPNCGADMR